MTPQVILTCTKCSAKGRPELFAKDNTTKRGYSSWCRKCRSAAYRARIKKARKQVGAKAYAERKRAAKLEVISYQLVYARDNGTCGLCKLPLTYADMTLDHIRPLNKGGLHNYANVQAAHKSCNSTKGDREQ